MSVTPINNQPIRFQNIDSIDESCDCLGQNFCQLINKNDPTQFQVNSTSIVTNGDFDNNLTGWNIFVALLVSVVITNESTEDACDGEIEVIATGGSGGYTYSIDGGAFGASDTFSSLCNGTYIITVIDSCGDTVQMSVSVSTNVDCGSLSGSLTSDLIPYNTSDFINCFTDDFI